MLLRSAIAVLAGFIVTVGLVMIGTSLLTATIDFPPEGGPGSTYLTLNIATSAIAALLGGATAMWLAPHTPHGHTIALAGVFLILALPTIFAAPSPDQPTWYGPLISVLGPVGVVVGGLIAARFKQRRSA